MPPWDRSTVAEAVVTGAPELLLETLIAAPVLPEIVSFLKLDTDDGAEWSLQLPARDYDDAKARLSRLAYANVDGELILVRAGE